jgi:hypothetical protein
MQKSNRTSPVPPILDHAAGAHLAAQRHLQSDSPVGGHTVTLDNELVF